MPHPELPLVDVESAPQPTRETLLALEKRYGFLPNLYRVFANASPALEAYLAMSDAYQRSSLTATERNVVLLATSRENGCRYCVAVHSAVGDMQRDAPTLVDALRAGEALDDPKLEALRALTVALVRGRGHAKAEIDAFIAAGYQPAQVLEVLVGITMKTLSNYTNHVAEAPLDPAFAKRRWTP